MVTSRLQWPAVLPDNVTTINELIIHLVEEKKVFKDEGNIHIFLRKGHAHQLTPKGRLWELADGALNLRFPGRAMDKVEYEDGAPVLDWVECAEDFTIALVDNGKEEMGFVLGTVPAVSRIDFCCLLTSLVLALPKSDRRTNKSVREYVDEYLRTCLAEAPSGYEIDRIRDISKSNDSSVASEVLNRNNFQITKHSLVVNLRTRI